jgi:putative aldouronate transport system permease protein
MKTKKTQKKVSLFDVINSIILIIIALACVYPFLYILFIACSNGTYLARGLVSFLPKGFNVEAFKYVLTNTKFDIFTGMKNSFIYTSLGTLIAIVFTFVTAYALSRPRFRHRYVIMTLFIITWVFEAGISNKSSGYKRSFGT